jgi:hypothetical protein
MRILPLLSALLLIGCAVKPEPTDPIYSSGVVVRDLPSQPARAPARPTLPPGHIKTPEAEREREMWMSIFATPEERSAYWIDRQRRKAREND